MDYYAVIDTILEKNINKYIYIDVLYEKILKKNKNDMYNNHDDKYIFLLHVYTYINSNYDVKFIKGNNNIVYIGLFEFDYVQEDETILAELDETNSCSNENEIGEDNSDYEPEYEENISLESDPENEETEDETEDENEDEEYIPSEDEETEDETEDEEILKEDEEYIPSEDEETEDDDEEYIPSEDEETEDENEEYIPSEDEETEDEDRLLSNININKLIQYIIKTKNNELIDILMSYKDENTNIMHILFKNNMYDELEEILEVDNVDLLMEKDNNNKYALDYSNEISLKKVLNKNILFTMNLNNELKTLKKQQKTNQNDIQLFYILINFGAFMISIYYLLFDDKYKYAKYML